MIVSDTDPGLAPASHGGSSLYVHSSKTLHTGEAMRVAPLPLTAGHCDLRCGRGVPPQHNVVFCPHTAKPRTSLHCSDANITRARQHGLTQQYVAASCNSLLLRGQRRAPRYSRPDKS